MAECIREAEVLECAMSGRPAGALTEHIASCSTCRDVFDAARAVSDDRAMVMREAHPPSPGVMWWRIRMREKREAEQTAVRAGTLVQVTLLAVAVAIAVTILGVSVDVNAIVQSIIASAGRFAIPALAVVAWLILAPVALYYAVTDR